jgi:hypothetical protein
VGGPGIGGMLNFRVQLGEPAVASAKAGTALFTVLVKGAGFSSMRNILRAKKGQIGIGLREREN